MKDLPEDTTGTAMPPAAEHLFKTRDNVVRLDEKQAGLFQRMAEQLLFACKRGRPDIQTAIAFLCTRVKNPEQDNYKKLTGIIKYIGRILFLQLTMEASHLVQNHWFIDGKFVMHYDMKSDSRSFMTFGKEMMIG